MLGQIFTQWRRNRGVGVAEFRCYLLDGNRKVMAVESIRALTLPRAMTKGILATVFRRAETFELWRNDLCVYVHHAAIAPAPTIGVASVFSIRRDAGDS
jgi:hypothetical protein